MSKTSYRQCTLRRVIPTGHVTQVSYIPEKFAVVGRILKLKNDDDTWTDGWKVIAAGALNADPPDAHAAIKGHRQNTGDSAPKTHG
jgi:hypothetical protein